MTFMANGERWILSCQFFKIRNLRRKRLLYKLSFPAHFGRISSLFAIG